MALGKDESSGAGLETAPYKKWSDLHRLISDVEARESTGDVIGDAERDISVVGYVMSVRKLSKKVFFFDLLEPDMVEQAMGEERRKGKDEVVMEQEKEGDIRYTVVLGGICEMPRIGADAEAVATQRKRCVVGNKIRVSGRLDRNNKGAIVILGSDVELLHSFDLEAEAEGNARLAHKSTHKSADGTSTRPEVLRFQQLITEIGWRKLPLGAPQDRLPALCKKWMRQALSDPEKYRDVRTCGSQNCALRHYWASPEEEARYVQSRKDVAAVPMVVEDPIHGPQDKKSSSLRYAEFSKFLIETYGKQFMNTGTGVADIAGGAGAITFELYIREKVMCTLYDPRIPKVSKYHQKCLKKKAKRERRALEADEENGDEHEGQDKDPVLDVFEMTDEKEDSDDLPKQEEAGRAEEESCCGGGCERSLANQHAWGDAEVTFPHHAMLFDEKVAQSFDALRDASLFIGMHPDQATCPIVNAGLLLNKPFCVVPCCVFSSLFPDRRTSDGEPVATYPQYIQYLRERDPRIRTAFLPMKGRNCVLYLHPDDC